MQLCFTNTCNMSSHQAKENVVIVHAFAVLQDALVLEMRAYMDPYVDNSVADVNSCKLMIIELTALAIADGRIQSILSKKRI